MLNARPVRGSFRRLRWWANALLIAILFAIPWIQIGGEPLILLDIPNRKFHVFGLVIFPQELYFLWLILAMAALSLFFFTALAGRLWCGWACPQTVFTDVFAAIARGIQGWKGGTSPPPHIPLWRKLATHAVWIALSFIIGFHLVGYFHSPYDLLAQAAKGKIYPTVLGFHLFAAALSYLDFAVIRQTFCKYLCPYARFQGVLFDSDTLVVGYDEKRGEPRGKAGTVKGDCVDCGLCVAVCPTEIDIREGLQLECIACTQCIDACNGVMEKLGRAANLIGYSSLVHLERIRSAKILRPRVLVYGTFLVVLGLSFVTLIGRRLPMELYVAHNRAALSSTMADGRIGNAFNLHLENRDRAPHEFLLRLKEDELFELVTGRNPIPVDAISAVETRVFVVARNGGADPTKPHEIRFVLERLGEKPRQLVRESRFLAVGAPHAH